MMDGVWLADCQGCGRQAVEEVREGSIKAFRIFKYWEVILLYYTHSFDSNNIGSMITKQSKAVPCTSCNITMLFRLKIYLCSLPSDATTRPRVQGKTRMTHSLMSCESSASRCHGTSRWLLAHAGRCSGSMMLYI